MKIVAKAANKSKGYNYTLVDHGASYNGGPPDNYKVHADYNRLVLSFNCTDISMTPDGEYAVRIELMSEEIERLFSEAVVAKSNSKIKDLEEKLEKLEKKFSRSGGTTKRINLAPQKPIK